MGVDGFLIKRGIPTCLRGEQLLQLLQLGAS